MDTGAKPLLIGNAPQQLGQLRSLVVAQCRTQRGLMLARHAADGFECVPTLGGEKQGVAPAIARVVATLDKPAMLEVIDQHHESTRQHAQFGAERLLTQSLRGVDESQDPRMRRDQSDSFKPLTKFGGRMRPDLGEQERWRRSPAHGR
jgi:hypothetical protein